MHAAAARDAHREVVAVAERAVHTPLGTSRAVWSDSTDPRFSAKSVPPSAALPAPSNRALRPPPPAHTSTPTSGLMCAQFSRAARTTTPLERRPRAGRGPTPTRAWVDCPRSRNAPPRPAVHPATSPRCRSSSAASCAAAAPLRRALAARPAAHGLVAARLPRVPTASSTPRIARDAPTLRHRPPSRR